MIVQIAVASALACSSGPLSLSQAEALVLATPNIQASVSERHARPFFEWVQRGPQGWRFDVNAQNPCVAARACSGLLGHYAVNRTTGEVEDLDAAGGDGALVSSAALTKLRTKFLKGRCGQL